MTLKDEQQAGMILCPYCRFEMITKHRESYKTFYICINENCNAVSVIVTTTTKL
ncbi:hypothetical protein ES705_37195 [subsurface metagenome]